MNRELLPTAGGAAAANEHAVRSSARLEDFLSGLLAAGPPDRVKQEVRSATTRAWTSLAELADGAPECVVLSRHPDLRFAFGDLPPFKVVRHRPAWGWGMKKEGWSAVMGRDIFSSSSLEFDAYRFLELDGTNIAYIEQPIKMRFEMGGKKRLYTPDALVLRASGLECIEVKFESHACRDEPKWQAIGAALAGVGIGFRVLTELHLRRSPMHANIRRVFEARHARPSRAAADALRGELRTRRGLTVAEIILETGISFRNVCFLIRHGFLTADLTTSELGSGTTVFWSGRGASDPWQSRQ